MARDTSRRAASGTMDDQRERERIVRAGRRAGKGDEKGWLLCQAVELCPCA